MKATLVSEGVIKCWAHLKKKKKKECAGKTKCKRNGENESALEIRNQRSFFIILERHKYI